jgi:hypothetical protein
MQPATIGFGAHAPPLGCLMEEAYIKRALVATGTSF